jgi:O-antigen ligase
MARYLLRTHLTGPRRAPDTMNELMFFVLPVIVVVITLLGFLALAGVLHFTSRRDERWMHWVFYAALLAVGTINLTSGRDLSHGADAGYAAQAVGLSRPGEWVTRMVSLFVLMLSAERVVSTILRASSGVRMPERPKLLLPAFVVFWLGTSYVPMFMGAHPVAFTKEYLYTFLIGVAFIFSTAGGADRATLAARDAIAWFNVAGLLTAVFNPGVVLDMNYEQGLIPGLSRFTGLTQHSVIYGLAVQFGMLCLWAKPYQRRWVNAIAWALLLISFVWAQSKTAWTSTFVCIVIVAFTNYRAVLSKALLDPQKPALSVGLLVTGLVGLAGLVLALLFVDVGGIANSFLASQEGANITSLTGRDKIWAVAFDEWAKYPVFGYGLSLFDADFRLLIRISSATHAHNQFIDVLAKAGLVGAACLVFYWLVLLYWSVRYTTATGGLSILLCTVLYLRSISEIPFVMSGYGVDFLVHILLLSLICGAHEKQQLEMVQQKGVRQRAAAQGHRQIGAQV